MNKFKLVFIVTLAAVLLIGSIAGYVIEIRKTYAMEEQLEALREKVTQQGQRNAEIESLTAENTALRQEVTDLNKLDHFSAIEEQNLEKLPWDVSEEYRAYPLWNFGLYHPIQVNAITYQFERVYQSNIRTTKEIVVDVTYNNDKYGAFVLQNRNNEGWRIIDID